MSLYHFTCTAVASGYILLWLLMAYPWPKKDPTL